MTNLQTKICIKKLSGIILCGDRANNPEYAATLAASMMSLGFSPSKELYEVLKTLTCKELEDFQKEVIPVLQEMKGAHVQHKPMYPNFPEQVMEASDAELFFNAICHYWTEGRWEPEYQKLPREIQFEQTKFQEIGLVSREDYLKIFTRLLSSSDSLSEEDKSYIEHFMVEEPNVSYPDTIPFKENMCVVAGMFLKANMDISALVKTATDVLRIVTYLNDGDVSLAGNTKFKSMPRAQRRLIIKQLNRVVNEEDINRHRNKWIALFHNLHVGDYASPVLAEVAKKIRNKGRIETFNGRVEKAIASRDMRGVVSLLQKRPGVFARRLDELVRVFTNADHQDRTLVGGFADVADQVPTRILSQVLGHFQSRGAWAPHRVIFPKGSTQKARLIPATKPLNAESLFQLTAGIENTLRERFSKLESLGKVWVDPDLLLCPVPSQQRSASEGTFNVARGTRLNFGNPENNTLRFFVHWVGQDIDLSATLHDENFQMIERIAYTKVRSEKFEACHSGDKIQAPAPNGASEFIDITIDKAAQNGIRYVAMNVLVYNGGDRPTFADHDICFAGWMTRKHPGSNEIFDAKTVEQKIDLRAKSKNAIPVIFDLVERKAIWTDLVTARNIRWGGHRVGNNVEANKANIEQTLQAIVTSASKLSLHKLFTLHAQARGEIVDSKEDAETIFSMHEGTTPYDINVISSEYLI